MRKEHGKREPAPTNNAAHVHYDTALDNGRPLASGIVDGAARHLVADRLYPCPDQHNYELLA